MASNIPSKLPGGCLCGAIRYDILFKDEGSWPPMVATCQCSMCRKWTGSLVSTNLIVKKAQVSPAWPTFTTLKEYQSTPSSKRAFCSECGSGVAWFSDDMPDEFVIFVGTLDEEYLMGKVIQETVRETEHGKEFERASAHGRLLTDSSSAGNLYWQNAVVGITDNLPGPKFLQHFFDKVPLSESVK